MDSSLATLRPFFEAHRSRGEPLVLATVIGTQGSTYRKAGARMLLARNGALAGLLSGGCLESDLHQRALTVIEERRAQTVSYDARGSDDLIWGLGLGCEGAMRIFLQPAMPDADYAPLPRILHSPQHGRRETFATIVSTRNCDWPAGRCWFMDEPVDGPIARELSARCGEALRSGAANRALQLECDPAIEVFIGGLEPPVRLLLLGGGPDALAVIKQAALLGWAVTVVDHRPAYADAARLVAADRVIMAQPGEFSTHVRVSDFDAAVVMSHHLPSDLAYLQKLAQSEIGYVGLLGPAARRERLHAELADASKRLAGRLFGPVGLDIGAATPEAIALAIVGEIHAVLSGREGRSFSTTVPR